MNHSRIAQCEKENALKDTVIAALQSEIAAKDKLIALLEKK